MYQGRSISLTEEVYHGNHYVFNQTEIVRCVLQGRRLKCSAHDFVASLKPSEVSKKPLLQEFDQALWMEYREQGLRPEDPKVDGSFSPLPGVERDALWEIWRMEAQIQGISFLLFYYDYVEKEHGVLPFTPPFENPEETLAYADSLCWRVEGIWKASEPYRYSP